MYRVRRGTAPFSSGVPRTTCRACTCWIEMFRDVGARAVRVWARVGGQGLHPAADVMARQRAGAEHARVSPRGLRQSSGRAVEGRGVRGGSGVGAPESE